MSGEWIPKVLEGVPPEHYAGKDLRTSLGWISGDLISRALTAGKAGDKPECENLLRAAETFINEQARPRIRALGEGIVAQTPDRDVAQAATESVRDMERGIAWQLGAIEVIRKRYLEGATTTPQ
jgi:hypothetical protein